jgi:hypothetical protein
VLQRNLQVESLLFLFRNRSFAVGVVDVAVVGIGPVVVVVGGVVLLVVDD